MTSFSICWMKEWIIGPRQTRGSRSFTSRPIDIIFMPCASTGMIRFSNIPGSPARAEHQRNVRAVDVGRR